MQVSVTLVGTILMLQWCAMSLDILMQVRNNYILLCIRVLQMQATMYHDKCMHTVVSNNAGLLSLSNVSINSKPIYFVGYIAATALAGLMFSRQEEVFGVQGVECNGTEYMLSECQNSTMISDECLNGSHVAGVRCVRSKFKPLCVL